MVARKDVTGLPVAGLAMAIAAGHCWGSGAGHSRDGGVGTDGRPCLPPLGLERLDQPPRAPSGGHTLWGDCAVRPPPRLGPISPCLPHVVQQCPAPTEAGGECRPRWALLAAAPHEAL